MTPPGLVCAHRGASLDLPDNSVAAFVAAIATGCDVIETDVRMRGDGRLVLAHDTWDVAREDVVALDTLVELAWGRVGLDLEIVEAGLERAVLDAVDGFPGRLIVTSTVPEILSDVHRLTRGIDTGLVVEAPFCGDPFTLADQCGASIALVEEEIATPSLLGCAATSGRPLWVWTVNDERRLHQLLATSSVAGVITDDPALACRLRAEQAHLAN